MVAKDKKKKKKKKGKEAEVQFSWRTFFKIWRTFGRHLLPYWTWLTLAMIGLVLSILVDLAQPWPLKLIIDYIATPDRVLPSHLSWLQVFGESEARMLLTCALMIIGITIGQAVFGFIDKYLMAVVGEKLTVDVRERVFVHLQALSLGFHETSRSGDLVFRMTSDISKLKKLFVNAIQDFGAHSLKFTGLIATMLWMDWQLCLLALAVIPFLHLTTRIFSGNVHKFQTEKRERESDVASIVQENMASISLIQAYSGEKVEHARFQDKNQQSLMAEIKTALYSKLFKRIVQIIMAGGTAAVIYVAGRKVWNGALSPGDLVVFAAYLKSLYGPIDKFSETLVELSQSLVSGERLAELVDQPVVIKDAWDAVPAPAFKGNVQFEDLSFHYKKGTDVLKHLNLRIPAGETVALVGSSGAGKTTLANLILRFYDPTNGRLLIDGHDVRKLKVQGLRSQITVLLQDTYLFRKSIRDNLAYGMERTDEEVVAAAKAAQAHDFIMQLQQGYDTVVEEGGVNFSGGQKQRLNIARAILRDTPILILDEPTTGLDALAEAQVNKALMSLTAGRTTFVIAHRFSTIVNADRILLLEAGQIAAQGTHEELLTSSDSYRTLWELQFNDGKRGGEAS
jgi:ATP-binding cassette subfamily B protein